MADDETLLTVAQMAEATGVTAHTLRYYERAGLIRPVARNAGNQRRYSAADVDWVAFLLQLRQTGMPIAQMREYAALRQLGDATIDDRVRLLEAHQIAVREQIAVLRAHEKALDDKVRVYRRTLTTREGKKP
ncbi:MerR family transcriptional regulator [Microbacterium testaceum]|uniref:MerR family transcriptional regulator n=1 Tax=Microbacterium testaceum TaxID=2033 RepID=UPI000734470A|nr:MerR family transcriptional regulator [Microbacterium testaceum]KTS85238.1 MerR family transcriptional regulator [Microbacterium testaceum]